MKTEELTYDAVDDRPANWLGDLQSDRRAWPERHAQARLYFTEARFEDFDVVQTRPDKFVLTDKATGVEYRPVGFDPLQRPDPKRQRIAAFVVDDGGWLHFLRRRGEDAEPNEEVVLSWSHAEGRS
jgi:hypothetical protein